MDFAYKDYIINESDVEHLLKLCVICPKCNKDCKYKEFNNKWCFLHKKALFISYCKFRKDMKK